MFSGIVSLSIYLSICGVGVLQSKRPGFYNLVYALLVSDIYPYLASQTVEKEYSDPLDEIVLLCGVLGHNVQQDLHQSEYPGMRISTLTPFFRKVGNSAIGCSVKQTYCKQILIFAT